MRRTHVVAPLCFALIVLALVCAGTAAGAIATNSSEDLRTGWYPEASTITPQLVGGGTFGQMWSSPVTGQVYAQPLVTGIMSNVRTEAKCRLYRTRFTKIGEFFYLGPKGSMPFVTAMSS